MDSTRAQETKVVHSSSCSCKNMIQEGPGGPKAIGTEDFQQQPSCGEHRLSFYSLPGRV